MSAPQAHDYATMPFGSHDERTRLDRLDRDKRRKKKEQDMAQAREAAVARLTRPEIGCTHEEADRLVDEIGVEFIKANSDEAIAGKVSDARDAAEEKAYDPGDFNVDEVKAYAADHPDEVAAILEAEQTGKGRVTLVAALEELSGSAGPSGDGDTPAGSEDPELGPHLEGPSEGDAPDA